MKYQKFLSIITIGAGVLLLVNAAAVALISNFNLGVLALVLLAAALIMYGIACKQDKAKRWMHVSMAIICATILLFSSFLALFGRADTATYYEDAVIVLGAGIQGETVGASLAQRLDKTVEYHQKNPKAIIVVSGGKGPQENITEALAMQRYLVKRGVPEDQILREDKATSTYENFRFSSELIREKYPQKHSFVFITNSYHVYRAEKTAEEIGASCTHVGVGTKWYLVPVSYIREMMAVLKSWVV